MMNSNSCIPLSTRHVAACVLASLAAGGLVKAELPVNGRPVPQWIYLDNQMRGFMEDPGRNISAGVLGISRGGQVLYLRSFGTLHNGQSLPEHALFRQASVVKPITAAAIHRFDDAGGLGVDHLQRRAFNLIGNGGLLDVTLPPGIGLGDPRMPQISVGHLLNHSAGWDRNPQPVTAPFSWDFPLTRVREAGVQMNDPDALPTRPQLIGYSLQFPLNYAPGATTYTRPADVTPPGMPASTMMPGPGSTYANFGYLVLGEILEAYAPGGYLGYVGQEIMSARNWIPSTEWGLAHTLESQLLPREPAYLGSGVTNSVFDYTNPIDQVPWQYGGAHLETTMAHGGLLASCQAMLRFGRLYSVGYGSTGVGATQANELGRVVPPGGFTPGLDTYHTGSLVGTSTILRQLGRGTGAEDDIVIHIAFNKRHDTADWAAEMSEIVLAWLNFVDATHFWPTDTCDGFWVSVPEAAPDSGFGGYQTPFRGIGNALAQVADGSRLRLQSGISAWQGTIDKLVTIDAPEGPVTIGQP